MTGPTNTKARHAELFEQFNRLCDLPASRRQPMLERVRRRDRELADRLEALLAQERARSRDGESLLDSVWRVADQTLEPSRQGQTIGRFVLLSRIGAGGMGEVYRAHDEQLGRRVAVKLLPAVRSDDAAARSLLLREARMLARLSHPNVVQVYEAGVHEGLVFIVMEYIEGVTLREWLRERAPSLRGRGRWWPVVERFIEAGRGLVAAHELGLVHRDFKPDNVLID